MLSEISSCITHHRLAISMIILLYSTRGSAALECYQETNGCENPQCGTTVCPFATDVCHETQSMVVDPRTATILTTVTRGCTARPPADTPPCSLERARIRCTIYCDTDLCNTKSRLSTASTTTVVTVTKSVSSKAITSSTVSYNSASTNSPTETSSATRLSRHRMTASIMLTIGVTIAFGLCW
ncbi:uncharacterized protein LOC134187820 [Corticium candelabrum]|uniref:uncharacterized protein LOC134187820 n=1 Tax=Corticium candelabrum TaxID=121492 RepID=UPI002E269BE7|nr:uncharacterized protein LOC134187820 [Corticium candelabrum]